jgi:protein phosphatase
VQQEGSGICYTRTGRRFFNDQNLEQEFISRVHSALTRIGLWEELKTDWIALDCELMPWSAKAQELVRDQYAAVGAAASISLAEAVQVLGVANARDTTISSLLDKYKKRLEMAEQFKQAYRHYCWPVNSLDDIKLAPFHVLATESKTYFDKDHQWHMDTLAKLASDNDPLIIRTPYKIINLTQPESSDEGVRWWQELTDRGGEGMVVKPFDFIAKTERGLVQPAVKCRGREYLRIIYGPEYTTEEYLERLRQRGLSAKRSLAVREFALGVESLDRFVRREPLYRVHECVFGVLALESEPVDPRL